MYLDYNEILIRIIAALLAGGAVGFEREKRGRDAGFRTHVLVSVGACLFTLIELESIDRVVRFALANEAARQTVTVSVHRLTAQIITGIGFLGAGTIIVTKRSIKGLTTAASIWVCAALGIGAGYGFYIIVLSGVIVILLVLLAIKRIFPFPDMKLLSVVYRGQSDLASQLEGYLKNNRVKIIEAEAKFGLQGEEVVYEMDYHIDSRNVLAPDDFLREIQALGTFDQLVLRTIGDEYY